MAEATSSWAEAGGGRAKSTLAATVTNMIKSLRVTDDRAIVISCLTIS